jgi:hypothetical protein
MLGRKDYPNEEIDNARTAIERQLAAWDELVAAVQHETSDPKIMAALQAH